MHVGELGGGLLRWLVFDIGLGEVVIGGVRAVDGCRLLWSTLVNPNPELIPGPSRVRFPIGPDFFGRRASASSCSCISFG